MRISLGQCLLDTSVVKRDTLLAAAAPGAGNAGPAATITNRRRWLLWSALVGLLVIGQSLLVVLTLRYEDSRAMDRAESVAASTAQDVRRVAIQRLQAVQALQWWSEPGQWSAQARQMLARVPEIARLSAATPKVGSSVRSTVHWASPCSH